MFDGVTRSQLDDFAIKNTHIRFVLFCFVFLPTIIRGKKNTLVGSALENPGCGTVSMCSTCRLQVGNARKHFMENRDLKKRGLSQNFAPRACLWRSEARRRRISQGNPNEFPFPRNILYFILLLFCCGPPRGLNLWSRCPLPAASGCVPTGRVSRSRE